MRAARSLFGFAGLCLAAGAILHTAAFRKVAVVIDAAGLPGRFPALLKGLWLCNSLTAAGLALIFGCLAVQPRMMAKPLVLVLSSTLFGLAALLYLQIGSFLPAHILLVAALSALGGSIITR